MVIVAFQPGEKYAVNYTTLDQYDYGQVLRIQGLKLPKTVEVHFSTQETGGTSITRIGVTKDGVTDVLIPDSVLENGDTTQKYSIFAFVYVTDATSGKTEYRAELKVKARPKPEVPGGGDNPDIFHDVVLEVRNSAEKAEEAQKQAEGYAHGREDLPERAKDNAMYYAGKASEDAKKTAQDRTEVERLVESVSGIDEQVTKVEELSRNAQEAATQAGASAEQAELHKQAAETASSAAQTAAQKTEADRTSVKNMKTDVENLSTQVQKNKESVDKTAQDFALNAQQALADVNNAGQAQTERVQTAGETAVGNIQTAQSTATQAVETAKSEAIKAVQTEGTTQTGAVTAEGEKQVQAVQTAAQEIIADREQITKNKADVVELRQKKADAIVETASGTLLNVKNSANAFFEDFSMRGKTTQDGTPTPDAPVEIVSAGGGGTIEIKITGKNLLPNTRIPDKTENGITMKYKADGVYHLSGTSTNRFDSHTLNLSDISLPPGKYRFLTGKNVKSQIVVTQKNTGQDIWYRYEFTINTGDKLKYWYCTIVSGKIVDEDIYVYMERDTGNTLTVKDFEPPREPQTITLSPNRPLTKWDRLEKREGVWGIARNGDRKILDGTENWYEYTAYENEMLHCYFIESIKAESGFKKSFCTHFINTDSAWLNEIGKYGTYSDHKTLPNKYFVIDKPTVEDFKVWLAQQKEAGTPVELVYKTAKETWQPLPEETQKILNALYTNYPTTVVANSGDTEMELTYVADTKNYHLGREEVLQKQILEIQNALISQKISGGGIKVTNSAKLPIVKLSVFGKSEQITTTGANLFNALTITEKHWLNTENGNIEPASTFWTSDFIEVEEGDYCLTEKGTNRNCGYDEGKNFVKPLLASKGKITVTSGIKFIRVSGVYETIKPNNLMINRGPTTKPYEPYTGGKPSPSPEYPQGIAAKEFKDIKIHGKNLLGGKYYYVSYSLGVGFIKEDTFNQEPIFPYTPAEEVKGVGKTMYCKKGTTYTLSVTNANSNYAISIAEYASVEDTKNKDKCIGNARVSSTDRISYTALNDGILLCYIAGKWTDGTTTIHTCTDTELLQVEIGETATAYEPYTEQTFSLSEPVTLNALKVDVNGNYTDETGQQWITDEIDLARGKYVQRIARRMFDGNEQLGDDLGAKTSLWLRVDNIRPEMGLCNYGEIVKVNTIEQEELSFSVSGSGIYLYTTKTAVEFKNELKQKYDNGKPVEVLYALKTPIETDLPPETIAAFKRLHTNYPTTIASNNADAGMELTYTVDTQSYIDSKIAEINMQVVNTQKQLLQERSK